MSTAYPDRRHVRLVPLPVAQVTINLPDMIPRDLLTTSGHRVQLGELGATDVGMLAMAAARGTARTWHQVATIRLPEAQRREVPEPGGIHHAVVAAVAKRVAADQGYTWENLSLDTQDRYLIDAHAHTHHLLQELTRHV